MRIFIPILLSFLILWGCEEPEPAIQINNDPIKWSKRAYKGELGDSLVSGKTYLSVYPLIYNVSEYRTSRPTSTVSLRNPNEADSLIVTSAKFFNTEGDPIRTYFDYPIYIAPMETVQIVIAQKDIEGGPGANFIFTWKIKEGINKPIFDAVMITTVGGLGWAFSTDGKEIH